MSVQLQEVLKTDTLEIQRQKFNTLALDTFNVLAGGTNLNVGTIGIDDGTVTAPGLYFGTEPNLGVYKAGDTKWGFAAQNELVAAYGVHDFQPNQPNPNTFLFYKDVNFYSASSIVTSSITQRGSGYETNVDAGEFVTVYDNVSLTTISGQGSGATATIEVSALSGTITNSGSGYNPGLLSSVDLVNQSRTTAVGSGQIGSPGSGYVANTYTNVPLTGGTGTGARATIVCAVSGGPTVVTSVTVTDWGSGYAIGDQLSANDSDLGNSGSGAGFTYLVQDYTDVASGATANLTISGIQGSITDGGSGYTSGEYPNVELTNVSSTGSGAIANITVGDTGPGVGPVASVQIQESGSGYAVGDVLTATSLPGGNNFEFTITSYGFISNVEVTNAGQNYLVGDVLTADPFVLGSVFTNITNSGSAYVPGVYGSVPLTNVSSSGSNMLANVIITGDTIATGAVTNVGSGLSDGTYTGVTALNTPSSTFTVTVVPNPGTGTVNVYAVDSGSGSETQPALDVVPGNTYRFDVSDSSLSGHPLIFDGGTQGAALPAGVSFVTKGTAGTAGAFVDLIIAPTVDTALSLRYNCSVHDGMGNAINYINGTTGSYGSGGAVTVVVSGNQFSSVTFTTGGTNYQVNDVVQFAVQDLGGSGTPGEFTISSFTYTGVVSSVVITDPGSGYSAGDTLTANDSDLGGGGGSNFQLEITSYFGGSGFQYTIAGFGSVTSATITDPGDGYTQGAVLSVDPGDLGTLAGNVIDAFELTVNSVGSVKSAQQGSSGNSSFKKLTVGIDVDQAFPLLNDSSQAASFAVNGKSLFKDVVEISNGSFIQPGFRFETKPLVGIFSEGASNDNNMVFKTSGGRALKFSEADTRSYKDFIFSLQEIGNTTIIGGSGYTQGSYTGYTLEGGSGSGAQIDFTVAFSHTLTAGGSGYDPTLGTTVWEDIPLDGGNGTGALARVTVEDGVVTNVVVTDGGDGNYQEFDVLLIPGANFINAGGGGTGNGASITIKKIGAVSDITVVNTGSGYNQNDILNFLDPDENTLGGTGFQLQIDSILDTEQGKYVIGTGILESKGFKTTESGLNISDKILLSNDTIAKTTAGELKITPFGSSDIVSITGTTAFKVPVGTLGQRPLNPVAGLIRFNNESQSYEAYDGANWGSLGGTRDVDGNTYILPESAPGANENILFFYNDAVNSLDVEQSKINLYTATTIESLITGASSTNIVPWEAGAAATAAVLPLVNYVHYNYNLYSVDTTGTLDATTPPTHTTGTVTNGTVDLTYVSSTYGNLTVNAAQIGVYGESGVSVNNLEFDWDGTTGELTVNGFQDDLKIGSGGDTPEYSLLNITSSGALQVNTSFGASETYTTVLDSSLRNFQLRDLQTVSTKSNLVKGTTNSSSFVLYDPTTAVGAKVTIVADNTTAGEKEILELSVIDSGSDIYNIEIGDVYTSASKIVDVDLDFNPSGNVRITYTLDASVAAADNVTVTVVSQRIKK